MTQPSSPARPTVPTLPGPAVATPGGPGTPPIAFIPLTKGRQAVVDAADTEMLSQFKWYADMRRGLCYAKRCFRLSDGRWTSQFMHALLTEYPETDHINGNGLDNRRANLRPVSHAQNTANQRKRQGRSQFKGIHWSKRDKRWGAQITVARKKIWLGGFVDETTAARAYDAAARAHSGEYAALNFPTDGERSALALTIQQAVR